MSGIDKIIRQIEEDTKTVCDGMIAQASAKAAQITAEAEQEAAAVKNRSDQHISAAVTDIKKRGDSAADLEEKMILLKTKQGIISDMLAIGIERVKNLPDEEYFALILKMVQKYSQPQDGVIRFGKKDLSRLPKNYLSAVNQVAAGALTLSDDCAPIDAGFILIYGGIEENCSFDAIFAGADETVKDKAGKLLF